MATPAKNPHRKRSQFSETRRVLEKFDTNHLFPTTPTPRKPINLPKKSGTPKTPTPARGRKPVSSSCKKKKNTTKKEEVSEKVTETEVSVEELEGSSKVRKLKSIMLEEAMSDVPEPGAGRVMHMVKAFEKLLSFTKKGESGDREAKKGGRVVNWALPGLQQQPKAEETEVSSYSNFSSSSPDYERDFCEQSSVDRSGDRFSWGSSRSDSDRRSRSKCLVKPSVKEFTEPIDFVLHSDVRAVERAEFDFHVAERLSLSEQINLERERRRKLEEEKEIRRLRKELVPKAKPMPYFDRPFIATRSPRPRTVPQEPTLVAHSKKTGKLLKRAHG